MRCRKLFSILVLLTTPFLAKGQSTVPVLEDATAVSTSESAGPQSVVKEAAVHTVSVPTNSLQEQIDTASPGSKIVVPHGIHRGNLRVNKSVTLIGEPGAEIQGIGKGCVIEIVAPNVGIENLRITQSGTDLSSDDAGIRIEADHVIIQGNNLQNVLHGIYLKGASFAQIINNQITGWSMEVESSDIDNSAMCSTTSDRRGNGIHAWNSNHNNIIGNTISGMRDGIYLSFTRHSLIEGNDVSLCRYGLHYMYSDDNIVMDNTFSQNAAGAALMFSKNLDVKENHFLDHSGNRAGGLVLHSVDYSKITNNISRKNRTALYMQNCNGNTFVGNKVGQNYIGLRVTGSSTGNRFSENVLTGNLHNVDITGRTDRNQWDDGKRGNYWEGSTSIDLDGDGVGEWSHREVDLLGPVRHEFPLVALLSGGPFIRTLQFAIQRSPDPGLFTITDKHPLLPSGEKP